MTFSCLRLASSCFLLEKDQDRPPGPQSQSSSLSSWSGWRAQGRGEVRLSSHHFRKVCPTPDPVALLTPFYTILASYLSLPTRRRSTHFPRWTTIDWLPLLLQGTVQPSPPRVCGRSSSSPDSSLGHVPLFYSPHARSTDPFTKLFTFVSPVPSVPCIY